MISKQQEVVSILKKMDVGDKEIFAEDLVGTLRSTLSYMHKYCEILNVPRRFYITRKLSDGSYTCLRNY